MHILTIYRNTAPANNRLVPCITLSVDIGKVGIGVRVSVMGWDQGTTEVAGN